MPRGKAFSLSPETEARMQRLWEDHPELTAEAIGQRFGLSKNSVIDMVKRRGWKIRRACQVGPRGKEPPTISDRLNALNRKMDAVLKETVGVGRIAESSIKVSGERPL